MPANDALKEDRVGKSFNFSFFTFCDCPLHKKYLLKVRGDNVFIYQNIIIHYKYLHNNLRTFVEFLDQSIYAFVCPAPPCGFSASPRPADFCPRPAGKSSAPYIPDTHTSTDTYEYSVVLTSNCSLHHYISCF